MTGVSELDNPETIWVLLAELAKHQLNWGDQIQKEGATRLRDEIRRVFPPVSYELLECAQKDNRSSFPDYTYLHLPLDSKGGWKQPVLKVSFDTNDKGHRVFRVKTAILVKHEEKNGSGEIKQTHCGIGIRFESREGPAGEGIHDYHHAQWFCAFEKGGAKLPNCPEWLPEVHPAIPIQADNYVDILCCALKSYYGTKSEPLCWLASMVMPGKSLYRKVGEETRKRINHWANTK